MKILFVIPCDDIIPSGVVRAKRYFPHLKTHQIRYKVINYYSPFYLRYKRLYRKHKYHKNIVIRSTIMVGLNFSGWINSIHIQLVKIYVLLFFKKFNIIYWVKALPSIKFINFLKQKQIPFIFDFDDAIFLDHPEKTQAILKAAILVVTGNSYLHEYAQRYNPNCRILPSSVNLDKFKATETTISNSTTLRDVIRIGWLGSSSTANYLELLITPFQKLVQSGNKIELHLYGIEEHLPIKNKFNFLTNKSIAFYTDDNIPEILGSVDICVMPLFDTEWEKGKCAMKALLYMAAGKPTVASAVGEVKNIIEDGNNGLLAKNQTDWYKKLFDLVTNHEYRHQLGITGRVTIENHFSTEKSFQNLLDILKTSHSMQVKFSCHD